MTPCPRCFMPAWSHPSAECGLTTDQVFEARRAALRNDKRHGLLPDVVDLLAAAMLAVWLLASLHLIGF